MSKIIISELLDTLYSNISPYNSAEEKYIDNCYPHTNIIESLLDVLFNNIKPKYIVECGSMLGGSALKMAKVLSKNNLDTEIICIDPFTGDVNMWDWEKKGGTGKGGWKFLRLENGIPTIYKRFLANCKYSGFENRILPINTTTSVGIKLLQKLYCQNRISQLPNYIYLDSAHEKDETFIELSLCWDCLLDGGILFGDDWSWGPVKNDVIKFSNTIKHCSNYKDIHRINELINGSTIFNNNILLYNGQWILIKQKLTKNNDNYKQNDDLYKKKDIDPILKIYCNKRKRVWFKDVKKCTKMIENPNTYIIYDKDLQQKILPGVDYVGPDLLDKPCSDLEQAKNLTFTNDTDFYFYIRGHIRNSFNTDRLKNFVKLLKLHFPNIKFILQTWKHKECKNNESWKQIKEDNTIISKQIMENYFEDKNITEHCLIIDEDTVELVGSTNGTICSGPCPKQGWKNMWYGIYKGLEHLDIKSSNNYIVSFRYDYFDIRQSYGIDEGKIIKFIKNNLDNNYIKFIKYTTPGTDNLYMGKYNKIKALIEKFNFKLDDILNMNKKIFHQEFLVNIVAETI